MTTPDGREELDQPPDPGAPPSDEQQGEEDESALVPALLAAYAAYLLWRGARDRTSVGWRIVADALQLRRILAGQLGAIALRSMVRLQRQTGRAGDEFWGVADKGVAAGVDAGIRAVAEALIWTDQNADGAPTTKDAGGNVPTRSEPPVALAGMVAQAVRSAAVMGLAIAAGWQGKTWRTRQDGRVRDAHASMEGQRQAIRDPFIAPGGEKLRYPGDPAAPIELVINCRCWVIPSRL